VIQKSKNIVTVFWILLIFTGISLYICPWSFNPIGFHNIKRILFSTLFIYNLKLLIHLKGNYVAVIFSWLVFISISTFFVVFGKYLLLKIVNYKQEQPKLSTAEEILSECSKFEILSLSWFLGSWLFSMIWFLLGLSGLLKKDIATALFWLGMLLFIVQLFKKIPTIAKLYKWILTYFTALIKRTHPYSKGCKDTIKLIGFSIVAIWIFSWSALEVYPVAYWDTLMVNMALPGHYVAESKLIPNPFNIYSYFAHNSEMLSVWTLLSGSKEAAFLMVWGFFIFLILFIYGYLSRVTSKTIAFCAITILVSSQLGQWLGILIKNDLQAGIFLILQWWSLLWSYKKYLYGKSDFINWQFLAGLFAGIACGHKFTAAPAFVVTFLGNVLFFFFNSNTGLNNRFFLSIKNSFVFSLGTLLAWGPWLIKSLIITGVPIYPFLNKLFNTTLLYEWHTRPPTQYSLSSLGWEGILEYLGSLTRLKVVSPEGGAPIWWGPTAILCFSSFFCFSKLFEKEIRWIATIAAASWAFSLVFAMKPPYHAGPLIFLFCCCFGLAINKVFINSQSFLLSYTLILIVAWDFIRSWLMSLTKGNVILSLCLLFSGSPIWHDMVNITAGTPEYASIDEMQWVNYLINKYTQKKEKVLFMGTFRPYGIERRHYAAFTLDKQPILYFAEKSSDEYELKKQLVSLGIHHIVYDPGGWKQWLRRETVDGSHNIIISPTEISKIDLFMKRFTFLRFSVPSNHLMWYTIQGEEVKQQNFFSQPPFDSDDIYQFPLLYIQLARSLYDQGKILEAKSLANLLKKNSYIPKLKIHSEFLESVLTSK